MKENESITCRVEKLRGYMKKKKLDAFIIPSNDPHMSEYTPAHWQCRQWISGFNGSAGTAVVTLEKAALWTDSRYFLAAGQQLEGTPFTLMKDGLPDTPSIGTWLAETLSENAKAGIDGSLCTPAMLKMLESELSPRGISAELCEDPFNEVWNNRPELPTDKIEVHPLKYAGESAADKIHRLLGKARENGCDAMLLTALDEIAWTLNLRGNDVECNPVFVSYLLLSDRQNVLFVNPAKVSDEVRGTSFPIGRGNNALHGSCRCGEEFARMPDNDFQQVQLRHKVAFQRRRMRHHALYSRGNESREELRRNRRLPQCHAARWCGNGNVFEPAEERSKKRHNRNGSGQTAHFPAC